MKQNTQTTNTDSRTYELKSMFPFFHATDMQKAVNSLPYETDTQIKVANFIIEAVSNYQKLLGIAGSIGGNKRSL